MLSDEDLRKMLDACARRVAEHINVVRENLGLGGMVAYSYPFPGMFLAVRMAPVAVVKLHKEFSFGLVFREMMDVGRGEGT